MISDMNNIEKHVYANDNSLTTTQSLTIFGLQDFCFKLYSCLYHCTSLE